MSDVFWPTGDPHPLRDIGELTGLKDFHVKLTGHWWPPTADHLRECQYCQQEMNRLRLAHEAENSQN